MKKLLIILAVALIILTSCQTTEETATGSTIVQEQTPTSVATFKIPNTDETIVAGLGAKIVNDYLYVAGYGDLGYIVTSMNMAKSNCMQLVAEHVNNSIITAAQNYAQGGGLVNNSSERDVQSVINNAVATMNRAQAQISGIEYVDYLVGENESVYVLARISTDKLSETIKNEAQSILRNDAAVQANKEAKSFFQQLAADGIF